MTRVPSRLRARFLAQAPNLARWQRNPMRIGLARWRQGGSPAMGRERSSSQTDSMTQANISLEPKRSVTLSTAANR